MERFARDCDLELAHVAADERYRVQIAHRHPEGRKIDWNEWLGPRPSKGMAEGLYSAFTDPPHGLSWTQSERESCFEEFISLVHLTSPMEIFAWDTDWSNYFDAGHEWWDSHFWTTLVDDGAAICVIGASTTD